MKSSPKNPTPNPFPYIFKEPVMTFQQVADVLGVSDNCVMHTERRAFKKLREILKRRLEGYSQIETEESL